MYGYGYSYPNNPQGSGLMGRYEAGVRSDGGSFAFPIDTGLASRLEGLGLLNASSLVNSCNAGKESVLYNLVPTPVQSLDRFTVARAGTKWVLGANGLLTEVQANFPAFEYNADGTYRGLLVEPAGTNQIRNNTMVGAVAGSPGTLPNNWFTTLNGLSQEIVGVGTEIGIGYIDIRFVGTATGTSVAISLESSTQIVASVGQVWTPSAWIKIVSAPTPPTAYGIGTREGTAAGAFLASGATAYTPTTTLTRYSGTRTLPNASTERVRPDLNFTVVNGNSYDFTIRIGWPQMELGSVATSPILTTGSTANRVADNVTLTGASSLIGQPAGTLSLEYESCDTPATSWPMAISTDGTNRILFIRNSNKTISAYVETGGAVQASISTAGMPSGVQRIAIAYNTNDVAFYNAGVLVGTDAIATIPSMNNVFLGANFYNGWIRSAVLFTTRLPNATLQALTS